MQDKTLSKNERASLIKKGTHRPRPQKEKLVPEVLSENDIFLKELQIKYNKNINNISKENSEFDYVKVALTEAEQIWANTQILMRTPDYKTMTDPEKVSLIQKDFAEFYKNFPIVSRYMICYGQYRVKAFKKMLIKCNETKKPAGQENTKDMNEKLWVDRQADYVRFLWEEVQDGNTFDKKDSDDIWQQTHKLLTEEFQQFKDLHDMAEKKIKTDAVKHKKELLYEMSSRIVNGQQSLDNANKTSLLNKLKGRLFKQRFKQVITSINSNNETVATCESVGTNDMEKETYDDEMKQSFYKKNYKKMDLDKIMK
jgi:hypothetical protein